MSKKPRNSNPTQLAAEAIVQRNLANLPGELAIFVTPSQIKKAQQHVQASIEKEQAGFGRKVKNLSYRLRGAYPEPAWFKNCIRVFATPETPANGNRAHVKGRSLRGWTAKTPKQIKAEADAVVLKVRADRKAALKKEAALRHADYVAAMKMREKRQAMQQGQIEHTEEERVQLDVMIEQLDARMSPKVLSAVERDWFLRPPVIGAAPAVA